jgi:hypothetical protein
MRSSLSSGGDVEPMSLELLLELISGDIVGMKRHQDVLRTLLSSPAGEWRELRQLDPTDALAAECRGYSPDLGPTVLDGLRLAWTLHPDEPPGSPFCLILFFYGQDGLIWHSLAIFNRDTL